MDASFTNSRERLEQANRVPESHWYGLTLAQQIRSIELEGFVVIPDLLSDELMEEIRRETSRVTTRSTDYSDNQRSRPNLQWTDSPRATSVIALPATVEFLEELLGDELICTSCTYTESRPGHPGIAIHTDSQPFGSKIFGVQASSPCLVRVLYYLDDLTPECSPFKVIPRSHLSLHRDANPYNRYLSHDDELMMTCRAGSAAIINQKVFHANFPNYSDRTRRMLAIAYRPTWAGPIEDVPDRDPEKVAGLPPTVQKYFRSLNTRNIDFDLPNRPDNMARHAAGISPGRWSLSRLSGDRTRQFIAVDRDEPCPRQERLRWKMVRCGVSWRFWFSCLPALAGRDLNRERCRCRWVRKNRRGWTRSPSSSWGAGTTCRSFGGGWAA